MFKKTKFRNFLRRIGFQENGEIPFFEYFKKSAYGELPECWNMSAYLYWLREQYFDFLKMKNCYYINFMDFLVMRYSETYAVIPYTEEDGGEE